jgi:adenosylhomocysteine nucleosidase
MLAIVSAMQEEIAALLAALSDVTLAEHGRRRYYTGTLHSTRVVAVFSRWGKVAAAATVTELIATFQVSQLVFSGVAGGVDPALAVGDVVVGTRLIQHDLDASPIFARYEVPLLGKAVLQADAAVSARLGEAAHAFLREDFAASIDPAQRALLRIEAPKIVSGLVASGDKFFTSTAESRRCAHGCRRCCASRWRGPRWRKCVRSTAFRSGSCAAFPTPRTRIPCTTSPGF